MKCEIEFEEVEALRKRLAHEEQENERLRKELNALDEKALKDNAIELSEKLFEEYMAAVFKSLGFEEWSGRGVKHDIPYERIENPWQRRKDLDVTISAYVSKSFRSAFLNIGVVPQEVTELKS